MSFGIDVGLYMQIKKETLVKVEQEMGRKLTEEELEIFQKTARIAMIKGHNANRR